MCHTESRLTARCDHQSCRNTSVAYSLALPYYTLNANVSGELYLGRPQLGFCGPQSSGVIEHVVMAPLSLKKMSGSERRKEGNYASSDGSTSLDVFTSDDLGLTLLPRPQIQKKDVGERVQAANGRPTNICTTEQQGDGQRYPLELEEQCHPLTRRSTVDESRGGSCYFGLSKRAEIYSNTGSNDDEAVLGHDDCCSGIQGIHDPKRKDFTLSTEKVSQDSVNGVHHDGKANTKYARVPYHSSLAEEGRGIGRDILFNSFNQTLKGETRKNGLSGASDGLGSVPANEHDCGRKSNATACENSLRPEYCGPKCKLSEKLLLTSASGNIGGLTLTKSIVDNRVSKDYPLNLSTDLAQRPYQSTGTSERENTNSVIPETNNQSHIASALLVPAEFQSSKKALPTAHQQDLDSLQLSAQLILQPSQASHDFHAAPPKKASKSGKHLKRSWTRHFPIKSKGPPSKGQDNDHARISLRTLSCSIAGKTHSNSLKTGFARENDYRIVAHPNSRILASFPPTSIQGSSQASYDLESAIFKSVDDTVNVQSRLKAGIKRANSLPDLRHLHPSLNMYQQQGGQHFQSPPPQWEHDLVGNNLRDPGPNHTSPPTDNAAQSTLQDIPLDINTPLTGIPYHLMNGNVRQPGQSLGNSDRGFPFHGHSHVFNIGSSRQTLINNPVSTNNGLMNANRDLFNTGAEFLMMNENNVNLLRRLENLEHALHRAREQNQICKARIQELERVVEDLRQQLKSERAKNGKLPNDGVKTKSSRTRGVADTVEWARQSHPTAGQQSLNVRSASLGNVSVPPTNGNDGPSLEPGATMNTMALSTQRLDAPVPALATGLPVTQIENIQAPCSGSFQPEVQYLPGPYDPTGSPIPSISPYLTHPPNPAYSPYLTFSPGSACPPNSQPFGQCSSHGTQLGHPFQTQGNQIQQNPGDPFVGYFQQSPQLSVSRTLPAAVQADGSTSGTKRKSESEQYAGQGAKRQQHHVEIQPGLSSEQAASDEQAQREAWRKMSQKTFDWYNGVHPIKQIPKEGKQFGIPSASLPLTITHPAMAPQAPKGLIAPAPGRAPPKTTQKTPTKRKAPKTELEQKAMKAQYNKTYKAKKKQKELLEKNKAASNLEAPETTLPLSNVNNDADLLSRSPVYSAQEDEDHEGIEQSSDLDADFEEDPEITETPAADAESGNNNAYSPDHVALSEYFEAAMEDSGNDGPTAEESEESEEE